MKKNKTPKSFSFNVAKAESKNIRPLKARDGVAAAGCSDAGPFIGNFRKPRLFSGNDDGVFC